MSDGNLKQLARELLEYAEQMYLERCVAISVLQAANDPVAMATFQVAVNSLRDKVHRIFQPLYEKLHTATPDQELQDAIRMILQKLPKGPVN